MKKLLLTLFLLPLFLSAQDTIITKPAWKLIPKKDRTGTSKDTITTPGRTIICEITGGSNGYLFYKEAGKEQKIDAENVKYYAKAKTAKPTAPTIIETTKNENTRAQSFESSQPKIKIINLSAGDELIMAKNHFYIGAGIIGAGSLISIITLAKPTSYKIVGGVPVAQVDPIIYVGPVLMLVGGAFCFESHIHIGRAGTIMNQKSIGLKISPSSASLCLRF